IRRKNRQPLVPIFRQLTMMQAIELIGQFRIFGAVVLDLRKPGLAKLFAAFANPLAEMLVNSIRNKKLGIFRPAVSALGQTDFFFAERLSVSAASVLFVRSAIGDVTIDDDQRRPIVAVLESSKGAGQHLEIVGVADTRDVPTMTDKARGHVVAERQGGVAF